MVEGAVELVVVVAEAFAAECQRGGVVDAQAGGDDVGAAYGSVNEDAQRGGDQEEGED
jgi:hypothetical protein